MRVTRGALAAFNTVLSWGAGLVASTTREPGCQGTAWRPSWRWRRTSILVESLPATPAGAKLRLSRYQVGLLPYRRVATWHDMCEPAIVAGPWQVIHVVSRKLARR